MKAATMVSPMRLASLLLVVLVAGCLGSRAPDAPQGPGSTHPVAPSADREAAGQGSDRSATEPAGQEKAAGADTPPPAIHRESKYTVGVDMDSADGHPCNGPALNNCDAPTFRLDGTYDVEATLSWTSGDLDLYLYRGGQLVSADGVNGGADPSARTQTMHVHDLGPGEYSLVVTVRYGAAGSYTLDAAFSPPS